MSMKKMHLNGIWKYKKPGDKIWKGMPLPNNWQCAGLNNYKGRVYFSKSFNVMHINKDKDYWLRFFGVDYKAKIWLNNKLLGNHIGYFQPFEFRVNKSLKKGKNTLEVLVDSSPERIADWPHNKRMIKGVFGHHDIRPGSWHPQQGQDCSTGGIWNSIELEETDKVRIKRLWVNSKANLLIKIELQNTRNVTVPVVIKTNFGHKISKKLSPGTKIISLTCKIPNPKLWWTWDHGKQHLYKLKVAIETNSFKSQKEITFGIRELKFDKEQNLYLNGRRIFIRGSNIIPEEYLSRYSQKRIIKDIQLAKQANINALRLHAHVNRSEFYEACNRMGVLVWQDFPLQWEYNSNSAFLKEAKRQIKDMVQLLYNHPSICFWCCHNEPLKSKTITGPVLAKEVAKLDNTRPIIKTSDFEEHPYPGWFVGKMEHFAALPGKPLPSEFGAQALPNLSSLKKIIPKKYLWPPNWKYWSYRNFVFEQTFYIAGINKTRSLKGFINNSQEYQAKLLKTSIECYRVNKFSEINGVFQFMFVDPWPCISYSVLDYFRKPKKGYYALQKSYQPVLLVFYPERDTLTAGDKIRGIFYLINDYPYEFKGVKLKMKLGKHQWPIKKINIPANSAAYANKIVYPLPLSKQIKPGKYDFEMTLIDRSGKTISHNSCPIKLAKVPAGILPYNAKLF